MSKQDLELLNKLGFNGNVDELEKYVDKLQTEASKGNALVADSVYDEHWNLLQRLKPDSEIFKRNWETDDNELDSFDGILKKYGMASIQTIKDFRELNKFKERLDAIGEPVTLAASIKENGHSIRAVYRYGELISGTTRGRYKKGRDITRHLKLVMPNYVEEWSEIELIEVRGEAIVSLETFENKLSDTLKTPLSSVTSIIRESATEEEIKLLDVICYKILDMDGELGLESLEDEFKMLVGCGFKIPQMAKIGGVTSKNLESRLYTILEHFEDMMDENRVEYSCDGIVVAINDLKIFYGLGKSGNNWNGNFALKLGRYWGSSVYSSEIKEIEFCPGKRYFTPKAIVEPVKATNGSTVTTVPLYNIGVMARYGYYPGRLVYFRYGGETGVTTTDAGGNSVKV